MRFSATQLMPTESLWCSSSFLSSPPSPPSTTSYVIKNIILGISEFTATHPPPLPQHPPLILWGLTLGMIADFLGPLSSGVPNFWTWPTFCAWDYRLAVWLFTWAFRARKLRELRTADGGGGNNNNHRGEISPQLRNLDGAKFCPSTTSEKQAEEYDEAGDEGEQQKRISVVGKMLDGYFDRAMLAAALVLFLRLGLTAAFLFASIKYSVHTRRLLTYYYGQAKIYIGT